jgi:hypothetical protein
LFGLSGTILSLVNADVITGAYHVFFVFDDIQLMTSGALKVFTNEFKEVADRSNSKYITFYAVLNTSAFNICSEVVYFVCCVCWRNPKSNQLVN